MCPACPPVLEARALVFSDGFLINATYALLPFVVVGIVMHQFVKRLDRGGRHADHE
jgi:hypothetical protein